MDGARVPAHGNRGDGAPGWMADLPDRYEIVREHARGGMAVVYLAIDRKHDRRVALKVLSPELAAGLGAERFLREIQTAAHLNHPHIVPLLDSGIVEGSRPYYVMPFVEGESLKSRLERETAMAPGEVVRIARDLAEALAYAHDNGVIHRDIKPGNVLFSGSSVVLTDFGISAALDATPAEHLTRTGLAVGTVGYMSPEQASGDDVDGRADQYSLACTLYEAVAGRPPFAGSSAREVLAQQIQSKPAPVSTLVAVPSSFDEALLRALAPDPQERFPTTMAFLASLDGQAPSPDARRRAQLSPAVWAVAGVLAIVALASWLPWSSEAAPSGPFTASEPDSAVYAVFPFENRTESVVRLHEETLLAAGLRRWKGVEVIDGFQLLEKMLQAERNLSTDEAAELARGEGAGRLIMGGIDRMQDSSLLVTAVLYDAAADGAVMLATDDRYVAEVETNLDSLFSVMADHLLWRGEPRYSSPLNRISDSKPALDAYLVGEDSLRAWNLEAADSAFSRALAYDDDFAQAHLWLGLVRAWSGRPPSTWELPAAQAVRRSERLSTREAGMAQALERQSRFDYGEACDRWRKLTDEHPTSFASWYGLAVCLESDPLVVPSEESPTGFAFRSSRHQRIQAYRQSYRILPSILESFELDAYSALRERLYLTGDRYREGVTASQDTFAGFPLWVGDSLAFWPRPVEEAFEPRSIMERQLHTDAIGQQRRVFRDIVEVWAFDAPRSGPAREALAIAMAMNMDAAAIDTLRTARSMATDESDGLRLAATEVWLCLAFGLPDRADLLRRAKSLADSLLAAEPGTGDERMSAGLAALTGRAQRAAREYRLGGQQDVPGPQPLAGDQSALLVYAALGYPVDSLSVLSSRVTQGIARYVPDEDQHAIFGWLGLPASLAFFTQPLDGIERIEGDWLVDAQKAVARGDTVSATRALINRGGVDPSSPYSKTLDALFAEAALWSAVGEDDRVLEWLDPVLTSLPRKPSQVHDVERIAGLMRSAVLRADAASALGDRVAARRWANAVRILWSDADTDFRPIVNRMQTFVDAQDVVSAPTEEEV